MIRNIVFDLGGVIMTICQEEAIKRFKSIGLKNVENYLNPYTQTDIFGDIEEGKISAEQFRAKLSELIGKEVTYEECKFAWLGYRQDVPLRNLDILRKLKVQGYKLILLSNTNPFMMSWGLSGEFDGNGNSLESYFDSLYLSYKLGVMKPNKKIFQYIIDLCLCKFSIVSNRHLLYYLLQYLECNHYLAKNISVELCRLVV